MALQLLKDAGVTLKLQKWAFFKNGIYYLDYIIWPVRLKVANHTKKAVRELKTPTAVTEVRSFLRFCYVFRRFVQNLARIASPLSRRVKNQGKRPRHS